MATQKPLRCLVSCRHCQRPVMTVYWTGEQLRTLREHLRRCAPSDLAADPTRFEEELLKHFRVISVEGA